MTSGSGAPEVHSGRGGPCALVHVRVSVSVRLGVRRARARSRSSVSVHVLGPRALQAARRVAA
jgi:hypothetical protein